MFSSALFLRNTLRVKSTVTETSIFKNLLQKCVIRRFTNFRAIQENSRSFLTTNKRQISLTRFNKSSKNAEKDFDDAKKILNNVLLFKFERKVGFRVVIAFAFFQLFGLFSMAHNVYKTFCQNLFERTISWKQKLESNPFSILTIFIAFTCGPIIFMTIMFFSSRTIRKLILHKGGEKVTLVTYNIIPGQQIFTESLENLSCEASRTYRSTLPLKVKGRRFAYFIDTDGDILNENLFDFTVGMKRNLD